MWKIRIIPTVMLVALVVSACQPAVTSTPVAPPVSTASQSSPTSTGPLPLQSPTATGVVITPVGAWIQLKPESTSPGAAVAIDGYLPGGPSAAQAQSNESLLHANVCWQGCMNGIVLQGQSVVWSADQPGRFRIQFNVPAISWIQDNGAQPMVSGDYLVGVQCLGADQKGCAIRETQVSAKLHVEVNTAGGESKTIPSLEFNPTSGTAGQEVKVTGWAPLDQVIGSLAFGYSLVLLPPQGGQPIQLGDISQGLDGNLDGRFVVPQSMPGVGQLKAGQYTLALQAARPQVVQATQPLLLAQTPFQVGAGLTWQSLQLGKPAWLQYSGTISGYELFTTPSFPGWVAYCDTNNIRATRDDGKTWVTVPTATEKSVIAGYTFSVAAGSTACVSVVMDGGKPGSYYATYHAASKEYGAPPVFFMGFLTTDSGVTWKPVPLPEGASPENFGGFWAAGDRVEAFFTVEARGQDQPSAPLVEQTTDGGLTWTPSTPVCPQGQTGSCMRWGPTASTISGMGSPAPQWIMISNDSGSTWSYPGPSVELRMPGPNQLVTFSGEPMKALLLSGSADFPVRLSQDAGQTWVAVTLPAVPGAENPGVFPGLQALPDGSLVTQAGNNQWMLLKAGSSQWCLATGLAQAQQTSANQLAASGETLWWLKTLVGSFQVGNTPLATVGCQ